jgi:hypothetical protein
MTENLFKIVFGTIIVPRRVLQKEELKNSIDYGLAITLFLALWYAVVVIIMQFKGQIETYYFIFEACFWVFVFVPITLLLTYYLPPLLQKWIAPESEQLSRIHALNVFSLGFGVPSLFIAIVDMIIILSAPPQYIYDYAHGIKTVTPYNMTSNIVFSIIGLWTVVLTIYAFQITSKAKWWKAIIISIIVLIPLVAMLLTFIALESIQPF